MKRRGDPVTWRQSLRGYLWAGPWFVGFVFVTTGPLLFAGVISLTDWNGISDLGALVGSAAPAQEVPAELAALGKPPEWVGFANYGHALAGDPDFWPVLGRTAAYAVGSVVLTLSLALALAMFLDQKLRGISFFRTVFFMPAIVGGVATMVMWRWLYNPQFGLINTGLRRLYMAWNALVPESWEIGLEAVPGWITSEGWALPALILMAAWGCGNAMMIFLAGLQNVPQHLYEAASIDGAGPLGQFRHVTLPQLSPTIFFNLIMGIITSFQVFAQAYLLPASPGGPGKATLVYVLYLYQKAFEENEMGYACALGWILFGVILAVTLVIVGTSRRWVYYEGEGA